MKYTIPQLHSLSGRKTKGNCANGSSADAIEDLCTTGTGINNSGGGLYCMDGLGDTGCGNGTAAYNGSNNCETGTGADSACGAGGAD